MNITVLGSGGWGGIPAAFCNCRVCSHVKSHPESKDFRTRPEVLVSTEKGSFLIEISPDIRFQTSRHNLSGIKDFLISHDHFDHMSGLMQLNSWVKYILQTPPNLYCSAWTAEKLDLKREPVPKNIILLEPFNSFNLFDVTITPIPLYHESEVDEKLEKHELRKEYGFVLEHNGKKVIYLSDYYAIPDTSRKLITGADVIFMDGTYLLQEHFPEKPEQLGLKDDPDHLHGKDIIELAQSLQGKQIIYMNITHLSELTHDEMQELLPPNHSLSYDGLTLSFNY